MNDNKEDRLEQTRVLTKKLIDFFDKSGYDPGICVMACGHFVAAYHSSLPFGGEVLHEVFLAASRKTFQHNKDQKEPSDAKHPH